MRLLPQVNGVDSPRACGFDRQSVFDGDAPRRLDFAPVAPQAAAEPANSYGRAAPADRVSSAARYGWEARCCVGGEERYDGLVGWGGQGGEKSGR